MRIPPPEITSNYEGSSLNFALLSNEVHQKDIQFLSSLILIVLEMDNKALRFTRYVKWILLVDFIIIFVILSLSPLLPYWNCEYTFFLNYRARTLLSSKSFFISRRNLIRRKKMRMRHNASLLLNFIFIHIFLLCLNISFPRASDSRLVFHLLLTSFFSYWVQYLFVMAWLWDCDLFDWVILMKFELLEVP